MALVRHYTMSARRTSDGVVVTWSVSGAPDPTGVSAGTPIHTPGIVVSVREVDDGALPPVYIPLVPYLRVTAEHPIVVGFVVFDPSEYLREGLTPSLALVADGEVTTSGVTGTLSVVNSAEAVLASLEWTDTERVLKEDAITYPEGVVRAEVRVDTNGITDAAVDSFRVGGASLRVTWS